MKFCWLMALAVLVSFSTLAPAQDAVKNATPANAPANGLLLMPGGQKDLMQVIAYEPQPGDIILYDQDSKLIHTLYKFAGTNAPTHVSIVVARSDGTPAVLDYTGPSLMAARVGIVDLQPRLATFPGTVMVRRLRTPLTPEQNGELARFAQMQSGKGFAVGRFLLLFTPFTPRDGTRPAATSARDLQRGHWYCSELVAAAAVTAHIFDAASYRLHGICPRDFAYDETMDISSRYLPPVSWVADMNRAATQTGLPQFKKWLAGGR